MSSERLETVARIYQGWEKGDFTVGVADFDENATLVMDPELPESGVYVGRDGIRRYMTGFLEAWESLAIAAESLEEVGDTVLVEVRQTAIGQDSGAPVSFGYFQLWTFRGGQVIRLEAIKHEAKALEAIGQSGD